jgi:hypothetical protein
MAAIAARMALKAGPKLMKGAGKMPGGGGGGGAAAAGAGAAAGAAAGYSVPGHSGPINVTVNGPSWFPMARVPPIEGTDLASSGAALGSALGRALPGRGGGRSAAPKGKRGGKSGFMNPGAVPGPEPGVMNTVFIPLVLLLVACFIFFISRH